MEIYVIVDKDDYLWGSVFLDKAKSKEVVEEECYEYNGVEKGDVKFDWKPFRVIKFKEVEDETNN